MVGEHLAFTGAVRDQVVDVEDLACRLLQCLKETYAGRLTERYQLDGLAGQSGYELLCGIAKNRGMLISGGELDTLRAANTVMEEFRNGKLGRITLERP